MSNYNTYGVIYCITNKINGKKYVGLTTRGIKQRFEEHCKADSYIGKAIRKHGKRNFVVNKIDEACDKEDLFQKEVYWIKKLGTFGEGYNLTVGGEGADREPRLEIALTDRQQSFIQWVDEENKKKMDVDNREELLTAVFINLLQIYLIADTTSVKREAAKQIDRMRSLAAGVVSEVKRLGVIELKEFVTYLS